MSNQFIVGKLRDISKKYDRGGDVERAIAYNRAADAVEQATGTITSGKEASKLRGIGKSVSADIL